MAKFHRAVCALALLAMLTACAGPSASNGTPSGEPGAATQTKAATDGGDAGKGGTDGAAAGTLAAPGELPVAKEKQTIVVYHMPVGTEMDLNEYWVAQEWERLTNVHVEWVVPPAEQFKEKLNIAFAAGDQIDFVNKGESGSTNYTPTEVLRMAKQGFILPINDLIENNTKHLKERLAELPEWKEAYIATDGDMYAVPYYNECYHCLSGNKMYVNRSFLANLGIEEPTTTDEFREFLKRVVAEDANGNGDATDEIGLAGCGATGSRSVATFIMMSAFAYDDGGDRVYVDGGKVKAGFMDPQFKEGLRYLAGLYADGLIQKECFTQDTATLLKINSQKDESIVAAMANMHYGTVGTREEGKPARQSEYMAIAPLKGESGRQAALWSYYTPTGANTGGIGFVPATCSNPELVMRWIDYGYTEEGTMTAFYGLKGTAWDDPDEGGTGIDGRPATYKTLTLAEGDPWYGKMTLGHAPMYLTADIRLGMQAPSDEFDPEGKGAEAHYYKATRDKYSPYKVDIDTMLPPLYYPDDAISDIAKYKATINVFVEENIARFVIGELDVDKDWDAFQKQLVDLGAQKYLDLIQAAYDAKTAGAKE